LNIGCFLVSEGQFVKAVIPEELVIGLVTSLRTNGKEVVHLQSKSIEVEGVYIPAKGSTTKMMLIPDEEENNG
jgi:hypothetical protein